MNYNPQITKAYKKYKLIFKNILLNMLVGIPEIICLLLISFIIICDINLFLSNSFNSINLFSSFFILKFAKNNKNDT